MLAIKLKRIGKKKQAAFRVIVVEKKSKVRGRYAEDIGFYNPHTKALTIRKERASHWISRGAQPTATVHNLFVREGIIAGPKVPVHKRVVAKQEPAEAPAA